MRLNEAAVGTKDTIRDYPNNQIRLVTKTMLVPRVRVKFVRNYDLACAKFDVFMSWEPLQQTCQFKCN